MVNAGSATVDVLDLRDPHRPVRVASLDVVADLAPRSVGAPNSVDTGFGLLAVAGTADSKQVDGHVAFHFTPSLELLGVAPAGILPEMATFSGDRRDVLAANNGEPDITYANEPEGSVTIIDMLRSGGNTAWVTLQEANALAMIDIRKARVRRNVALGFKDHLEQSNELEVSDRDNAIEIAN